MKPSGLSTKRCARGSAGQGSRTSAARFPTWCAQACFAGTIKAMLSITENRGGQRHAVYTLLPSTRRALAPVSEGRDRSQRSEPNRR